MNSSYHEKPMPHHTMAEWHSNNKNLKKITDMRNLTNNHVRQVGAQIRNATDNTMKWKYRDTNSRLKERIDEVDQWYGNLEATLTDVKDQIQRLKEAKVAIESCLSDLLPLQEAAKEVIMVRDRRREIDLVEDEAYNEVKKELRLLDKIGGICRQLAHEAWERVLKLKDVRNRIAADLANKKHSNDIDEYKLSLTLESSGKTSFKLNPLDLPEDAVDMETWLRNCLQLKKDAEENTVKAMQLTNEIWGKLKTILDDISKQREVTQRALRKRHHETLHARDMLGVQRKDLMDEIDRLEKEMKSLEANIAEKMSGNKKLAETRLENRKWRRGMELCRDEAYEAMKDELAHIGKSIGILQQQLGDVKNSLNCTRHQLHKIEDDLERKEHSLAIENSSIEIHSKPPKVAYQTDLSWRAPVTSLAFSARPEIAKETDAMFHTKESHCIYPENMNQATMTDPCPGEEFLLID